MDKFSDILPSSSDLEEASLSPLEANRAWFNRSRTVREQLMDLIPAGMERIKEYVNTRMDEPRDMHSQSEFVLKLVNTSAMPQPTINFNQVNQISQSHQFKHYTPPVIVTKQEMLEATRIAIDSREEEKRLKTIMNDNAGEG